MLEKIENGNFKLIAREKETGELHQVRCILFDKGYVDTIETFTYKPGVW